ncbi:MAG TPA: hypothetical protein VNW06_04910 [Cytophagaceae bacterium]|nr:hypothetical protein [Cytophagaceae bacterium]
MKNRLLLLCFVIVSCSSPSKKELNSNSSGSIGDNKTKENGWVEGITKDSFKLKSLLDSGKAVEQYLIDLRSNDTLFQLNKFKGTKNYANMKVQSIFDKTIAENDTSKIKEIRFDPKGKLSFYRGPLDFLTKKDSTDLDKSYPDWKEQIKIWELSIKTINN